MTALAVAPAAEPAGYEQQVAELVDLEVLVARGLDLSRLRFVPAPSDPLFGYARCPARGCLNVTEHTATSLCSRCQHRYGRWQRATDADLERFLAEVTQTRSEDLERLCLVCRTPGHERPAAAQGVCYSCLSQAKGRGQNVAAYIAGDERWPPATPRATFGLCRMACDALACGSDGLCGEHLRHWRRAGRLAGSAFDAWRAQVGEPLPASRYVDLAALSETLRWEFLLGLSVGPPPVSWSQVVVVVVAVRNRRLCPAFSRAPALVLVRARPSGSPASWSASYSTGERIPSVECRRVGL